MKQQGYSSSYKKKREIFSDKIRNQQVKAIFERERKKMLKAKSEDDLQLANKIQQYLINLCQSKKDFQAIMNMCQQYEQSKQRFYKDAQIDEEFPINFQQQLENQKLHKQNMKMFKKIIEGEQEKFKNEKKNNQIKTNQLKQLEI